jgi:hypothetical protein
LGERSGYLAPDCKPLNNVWLFESLKTESASAVSRQQTAFIKQGRIARLTLVASCVIFVPLLFYSLVQNRLVSRVKLSGIATKARLTKKEAVLGQYWNGRPIDRAIITFKYGVASGETMETCQTVRKSSVANLSVGDEFTVWYDRAYPNRVLTSWNHDRDAIEVRIIGFILLLVLITAVVFAVTRPRKSD